jgi:hypothetical protein
MAAGSATSTPLSLRRSAAGVTAGIVVPSAERPSLVREGDKFVWVGRSVVLDMNVSTGFEIGKGDHAADVPRRREIAESVTLSPQSRDGAAK